jgi:hypothetical protein
MRKSIENGNRQVGRARTLGVTVVLLATSACEFGDDSGGGGCGGTPGTMGNLTFEFEQSSADLSDPAGRAFASGTSARFAVRVNDGSELPPVVAESGAPDVLSAGPDASADHPYRVDFHRTGIAALRMRKNVDGQVLDEVNLRVVDPRALSISVGGALSPSFDGGGLVGEPERVVLRPGTECRLFAHLTDGTEAALFGTFAPALMGGTIVSFADDGMTALALSGERVHAAVRVTALSEGTETVTIEGPAGLRRTLQVEVTAASSVETLELFLWPGYVTEFELGEQTAATAVGREADGSPVYGSAIDFESSDPAIVSVTADVLGPETARLDCLALGSATITARLADDPTVLDSLVLTVVPVTAEE